MTPRNHLNFPVKESCASVMNEVNGAKLKCMLWTTILSLIIVTVSYGLVFGVWKKEIDKRDAPLECQVTSISITNTTCNDNDLVIACYDVSLNICSETTCNSVSYLIFEDYNLARKVNLTTIVCYNKDNPTIVAPPIDLIWLILFLPVTLICWPVFFTAIIVGLCGYFNKKYRPTVV